MDLIHVDTTDGIIVQIMNKIFLDRNYEGPILRLQTDFVIPAIAQNLG